ncbi:MAG TPA: transglutaminase family protein, partial [Planctomycetota bacterium]|nr:transglutaminase family protein [Planctomycetota bacterium]
MSSSDPRLREADGRPREEGRVSPGTIEALIHLLGDENPNVWRVASQRLEELGEAAYPKLQEAAVTAEDAMVRLRTRRLLVEWRRREVLEEWVGACAGESIDLEQGALWISRSEYPNDSEAEARAQLDEYARVLRSRLSHIRTTESAVNRLVQLLAIELGFTGDDVDYDDPDSSYLHRVLETRRGLPIALSTAYLCVARRVGIPLSGVGMPHHFILRYETLAGPFFIDPFHDGRSMSRHDCRRFLERNGIFFQEH